MYKLFTFSLLSSIFLLPLGDWQLKKNEDGIKVYTRAVPNSALDEFKGVAAVNASVAQIEAVLKDVEAMPSWLPDNEVAELLKSEGNVLYYYSVTDAPFPVDDRDAILRFTFTKEGNNLRVSLIGLPDYKPAVSGRVRIPQIEGFWLLEPLGANKTKVTYQVLANPGGSIPAWLANATAVDNPFNTLKGLRGHVAR
jgi:hypothetical protein